MGEPRTFALRSDGLIRRLMFFCIGVEVALVVLDLLFAYMKLIPVRSLRHVFNLAREESIATWFASTQALFVGLVLGVIALVKRADGARRATVVGWTLLSLFFCYVAIDDAIELHERVGGAARRWLEARRGSSQGGWFPSYHWQLVYGPILGAAALLLLWLPWKELAEAGLRRFLVLGLACLGFAVGLDFVEGIDGAFERSAEALGVRRYTVSHLSKITEELLEMLGTTLLLVTFARHLAGLVRPARIVVE